MARTAAAAATAAAGPFTAAVVNLPRRLPRLNRAP
jgi:hypothetical protein